MVYTIYQQYMMMLYFIILVNCGLFNKPQIYKPYITLNKICASEPVNVKASLLDK